MKKIYKLYGIVSNINDKNIIIGGHNETLDKLKRINIPGNNPILDSNKFIVSYNSSHRCPICLEDKPNLIGEKIIVWVHVRKYTFKSQYSHNLGEEISGWKLHLVSLEKNNDWS